MPSDAGLLGFPETESPDLYRTATASNGNGKNRSRFATKVKMIIVPPTPAVIADLNSYYLDMEKLIEHYQAELRTGGIYLQSIAGEGMIFFDGDSIVNVFFQDEEKWLDGVAARDELIRILKVRNFSVSVYRIEPDKLHFWAALAYARDLEEKDDRNDASLDALIRRMSAENLTGYIDVSINAASDRAYIFFHGGSIVGLAYSWDDDGLYDTKQNLDRLILKSKTSGATYNIKHIDSAAQ